MKKLFALLSVIIMSGCAAPTYKHEVTGLEKSESVRLVDARPQYESDQKVFSVLITSDAYAIYRWGGQTLDPSALRLLQHKVYEKYNPTGAAQDLKVYHFVSYMNAQSAFRRTALFSIGGAVGGAIAGSTQNNDADFKFSRIDRSQFESITGDDEYTRAFVNEQENPNKAPVFVIYIDAEVNGKRQIVKGIAPANRTDGKNPYLVATEETINSFINSLN